MRKRTILLLAAIIFILSDKIFAQIVGINADGSIPNSSAMLDVKATNMGLLPPRLALTGTADATTIVSPAAGLFVYNTATAGTSPSNETPASFPVT
jgi:hypothetical protein